MEQTAQILSRIARQAEARDALDVNPQPALTQDGWQLLSSSAAGRPTPIQPSSPLFGQGHHNLPAQPTALRGRDQDLETAGRQLLRDDVRLLTLTGPAGTGKTRLAVALAESVIDFFPDGVFFIDLARIDDPALTSAAIAETLQIRQQRGLSLEDSLREALRDSHLLLILDNFEHIVPAAGQVAALLAACPRVKILVTSRATLRLRWEHQYPVRTLGLPAHPDLAEVAASPAAVLFVERTQAADPHFELTEDNAAEISELCARLDGLPLAIELAAARARLLPPRKLLARLRHRLDLLADGAADLPLRQQSLRRAIDYSFDLLPKEEQALFCRVALFPGGCTPEAAVALARTDDTSDEDDDTLELAETLDRLASLVHKSLLHEEQLPDDEVRFRMLEIVRDYALEKLASRGELEATRARWLAYFISLAETARKGLRGHSQRSWLERLDREHDNLRTAIRFCIDTGDADGALQLASSAWRFWYARGMYGEGREWLSQALEMAGARGRTRLRARALNAASNLAYYEGDYAAAEALQHESLAIRRELDNRRGAAQSLDTLALLALQQNDSSRATTLLEESLGIKRELGDEWGIADSLQYLAELASDEGHFSAARARFEESLLRFQGLGDSWSIAGVLESMAALAQAQGQSDRAVRLAGAAAGLRTSLGASGCSPVRRLKLQRTLESAQRALGANAANVRAEGQAMSLEDAVLFARSTTPTETASPAAAQPSATSSNLGTSSELAWLTPREREVSGLLLRGLSNRQIADELVITERTAETHVCRILSKLGLGSRAQIAAWALDHGLLESKAS